MWKRTFIEARAASALHQVDRGHATEKLSLIEPWTTVWTRLRRSALTVDTGNSYNSSSSPSRGFCPRALPLLRVAVWSFACLGSRFGKGGAVSPSIRQSRRPTIDSPAMQELIRSWFAHCNPSHFRLCIVARMISTRLPESATQFAHCASRIAHRESRTLLLDCGVGSTALTFDSQLAFLFASTWSTGSERRVATEWFTHSRWISGTERKTTPETLALLHEGRGCRVASSAASPADASARACGGGTRESVGERESE